MPNENSRQTAIDWAAVHSRLEHSAAALRGALTLTPDEQRELLARRARAVAHRPATVAASAAAISVIAFELAGQVFAFESTAVRETVSGRELAPMPGLPPRVAGLANVRSRVVPVFDLRPVLRLTLAPAGTTHALLILADQDAEYGILVEQVLGSRTFLSDSLRPSIDGLNQQFMRAVSPDGVVVLDATAISAALTVSDESNP